MNVRRLTVSAAAAGLAILVAPALAAPPSGSATGSSLIDTGSAGTGSSAIDNALGWTGSASLVQSGSAGGAFANCDEVYAAGRAPLFAGEPGYGPHLDPDGDGLACPTV
ncbi:excalibur calcium-binding domain-containing protein [Nocardia sp. CNY236]|uniref:excalibur calcium-binding domain-containing protein n=1 Tax=Nocardia sp. CNY236 TaxID=1169152 RepID=UPI0003F4DD69|nr:excalibur calcium-binding domain-containing protein [Nocardia sp. CNY236]